MATPLLAELNDEWVVHLLSVSACRRLSGDEIRHILLSVALPGARIPLKRLVIDAPPPVENGTIVLARKGLIKCVKKGMSLITLTLLLLLLLLYTVVPGPNLLS